MNSSNQQKTRLLSSMEKLIQYISINAQNQLEIFHSFSHEDISKVVKNFSDPNAKLRKLSLNLIGMLLNSNSALKYKFCTLMQIDSIPGNICLNFTSEAPYLSSKQTLVDLLNLVQSPVPTENRNCCLWMINLRHNPLKIDYVSASCLSYMDPLGHVAGFCLPAKNQFPELILESPLFSNNVYQGKMVSECQRINSSQQMTPLREKHSTASTQLSTRFQRTSRKKSLKCAANDRSRLNSSSNSKGKFLNITQRVKSESGSPRKENFQFNRKGINLVESPRDKKPQQDHSKESMGTRKVYQPIINNTNIYISSPIESIELKTYKQQANSSIQTQKYHRFTKPEQHLKACQEADSKEGISRPRISRSSYTPYERITNSSKNDGYISNLRQQSSCIPTIKQPQYIAKINIQSLN